MIDTPRIIALLQDAKPSLQKRYGFKSLALFGSPSHSGASSGDTIELLVELSEQVGMRFFDLEEELTKILGHKVELVARKSLERKYFKTLKPDLVYI